ncbi:hypothetical protein L249_2506 [Ophiocordyceps polyrhachis-furcata BCC 54312]|uniref:Sorting nexin MVP1 n=1 Tax=Ophiocordyceps polyrhachis-furcata BCC 54312 TaxID=1330021 RepID=A0A367LNL2_9HYPO|nr:hypothetical protein L249_2506 [Ophiocordyceps polyrhachis-furcata BCC 54312]
MSLFGSSPDAASKTPSRGQVKAGPEEGAEADDNGLFGGGDSSPWGLPVPRKQQTRADMIRKLLPSSEVPDSYAEVFTTVLRDDDDDDGDGGGDGRVSSAGIAKLFAAARLQPETQARVMSLLAAGDGASLDSGEFYVLLALIGLAQEGEVISLDGVDERRWNLPQPKLAGLTAEPTLPPIAELAAKTPPQPQPQPPQITTEAEAPPKMLRPAMDDPEEDPWNSPELHRGHNHVKANGVESVNGQNGFASESSTPIPSTRKYAATAGPPASSDVGSVPPGSAPGQGGWGYHQTTNSSARLDGLGQGGAQNAPFSGDGNADRTPGGEMPAASSSRPIAGRTGSSVEEHMVVTLMPEKEGMFLFQHHNYEVASQRRGSKVIRRYSDFVWLLDCLQKRYPFRVLPLLPPKRVAVNGNHLSNDGAFIEKRRRGLARFLNALVRHPVLSQEQLVVMFLTVPTELAVWRKQATISVVDEFADKAPPVGLEDSLPPTLEELFSRTRAGVRRSAELYINVCNIMDRLVKRTEGVAADHGRVAMTLASLTEASADTYATDPNEVPLLNDGLVATSKHLQTCQTLLEDESRGWDEGVLEDLKRQRDALVSVRDMFDRRERLDRDTIPSLERRIQGNETKLAGLRSKPEGTVKPGEIERIAESIIKDKVSIVEQHNRSVFVRECIRDELATFQASQYHVSRWNQDWAGERVKYAEMLADNWRRLLDELEGMPLGD